MGFSKITIKILKWDQYNPRKDFKKPFWFALSNRLVEDEDFFSFNHGEFKTWIYILSKASQKPSSEISVNLDHSERVSNISKKDFISSIEKLEQLQMITVSRTHDERDTNVASTLQTNKHPQNTTGQTNNIVASVDARQFDFESLYQSYPLKKGKSLGMEKLKKLIKCEEDFNAFANAIKNYTRDIQLRGTEAKYIKHFSSFVGTEKIQPWKDWLDSDAGASIAVFEQPKKLGRADQRSASNQAALETYLQSLKNEEIQNEI